MATDDVSVLLTLFVTSHALATLLLLHPHISIETKDVITSKSETEKDDDDDDGNTMDW
jgi:hypothetical protein